MYVRREPQNRHEFFEILDRESRGSGFGQQLEGLIPATQPRHLARSLSERPNL